MSQLGKDWNKYQYTSLFDTKNTNRVLANAVDTQLQGLDPQINDNFNSLVNKFPNQSKDFLLGAAKLGLNANSKGIERLASVDGLAQLKQDLANVDKLKSVAKEDKGLLQGVRDAVYSGIKGTTRALFATLQAPYQYATTVARELYSTARGENTGSPVERFQRLNPLTGLTSDTTNLGQLLEATRKGITEGKKIDTGAGFFIAHDSKVAKSQAKAMQAYGRINDQSFTIGRMTLNGLGADPNGTPYRVMSGIVDSVLAIGTDPSVWVGPGSVTKIIKGGKELQAAKEAGKRVVAARDEQIAAKQIEDIRAETLAEEARIKEFHGQKKNVIREVDNTYLKAERNLKKTRQSTERAKVRIAAQQLTQNLSRVKIGEAGLGAQLDNNAIGNFAIDIVQNGKSRETVEYLAQMSADLSNTKKAFTGLYFEEVPDAGRLHLGAYGDDEFIVAVSDKTPFNIYDINTTYETATLAERAAEVERRGAFFDELFRLTNDPDIPLATREGIDEFIGATTPGNTLMKSSYDDVLFGEGSESVARLIQRAIETQNDDVVQLVVSAVQNAWKADGFSNIRAIHGGAGGVVLTNYEKFSARYIRISDILDETAEGRMGPEAFAKLLTSIKSADDQLADAQRAFDEAQTAYSSVSRDMKEIDILQEFVRRDPELMAQIIKDPKNSGIARLMDLEENIKSGEWRKELIRSEVGLTEKFGGTLKADLKRAAEYVLGKRFAQVAQIVARETDFARLDRLFGRKLDKAMVKDLVDAQNSDEVISIFLRHLAAPESDPSIYRSLALRGREALLRQLLERLYQLLRKLSVISVDIFRVR